MTPKELSAKTVAELKKVAQDLNIIGISTKTKNALIEAILEKQPSEPKPDNAQIVKEQAKVVVPPTPVVQAPEVKAPEFKENPAAPSFQPQSPINQPKPINSNIVPGSKIIQAPSNGNNHNNNSQKTPCKLCLQGVIYKTPFPVC